MSRCVGLAYAQCQLHCHPHARSKRGACACAQTRDKTMSDGVGSLLFSAPELLLRSRYDQSVDVWSLGCVLSCLHFDRAEPFDEKMCDKVIGGGGGQLGMVAAGTAMPAIPDRPEYGQIVRECCRHDPRMRCSAKEALGLLQQAAMREYLEQDFR